VLPEFIKNGGGKVINITSIARVGAFPNCPEMTGAAVFLASEDSAAMHGATVMGRRRLVGLVASGAGVAGWRMPARAQCNASRKALRA
jgi:hypothetical protein